MLTTHDGEILFPIAYNGAAFTGPGRFDAEILQTGRSTQAYPDFTFSTPPVTVVCTLSQSLSIKNAKYIIANIGKTATTQSYTNDPNSYYTKNSASILKFDSTYQAPGPKLHKLHNARSRKFVTYYSMTAKYTGSQTVTYKHWVRQGSPGTVTDYPGTDVSNKATQLVDLAITAKWKVYL